MITINSPCWHDDGIVEVYAILLNATNKLHGLRAHRGRLLEARDALYDASRAFSLPDLDDEDYESHSAIFDALAFVTEAMQGNAPWISLLRHAMRSLERLRAVNQPA